MNILTFSDQKNSKTNLRSHIFEPLFITENNLLDDNRPYCYAQNVPEQQNLFRNINNYNEDDNTNEEYIFQNQNENHNENIISNINDNNASEYTTP